MYMYTVRILSSQAMHYKAWYWQIHFDYIQQFAHWDELSRESERVFNAAKQNSLKRLKYSWCFNLFIQMDKEDFSAVYSTWKAEGVHGHVLLKWNPAPTSILANGTAALIWKLYCHWLKWLTMAVSSFICKSGSWNVAWIVWMLHCHLTYLYIRWILYLDILYVKIYWYCCIAKHCQITMVKIQWHHALIMKTAW